MGFRKRDDTIGGHFLKVFVDDLFLDGPEQKLFGGGDFHVDDADCASRIVFGNSAASWTGRSENPPFASLS